jgi:hypothetical protein
MFYKVYGYTDVRRETLSTEIVFHAQKLANERQMTVILCGDWNCNVFKIKLSAGAYRPDPVNHNDKPERGKVDSMIIINPVRVEAGAAARAGTAAGAETAAGAAAEPGAARAEAEPGAAGAAGARAEAAPEAHKLTLDKVEFFRWTSNVTTADMGGLTPEAIDGIYHGGEGGKHRPIVANIKAD